MSDLPNLYTGLPDRPASWNNYDARITGGDTIKMDGERSLRLARPEGWTAEAACLGEWNLFASRAGTAEAERAKATCGQCPVRVECLAQSVSQEWTIGRSDYVGIRGGLDSRERYRYVRSLKDSETLGIQRDTVA